MALLQGVHRQGRTIILVTHDSGIAAYAERLIRLRDGKVASDEQQRPAGLAPTSCGAAA
jgi:ABC-type lipoprotein export system ATPase subunit